jgi:type VII secretion-associated serine protease mycosin
MVEVGAADRALGHRVTVHFTMRRLIDGILAVVLLSIPILTTAPAQAYSSQQWALDYLKANSVWQITKGSGITVAVIDTGVSPIPDLQGDLLSGADFSSGTISSGNGQTDLDGHGTGISAMIAGNGTYVQGLAPAVKILPIHGISGESGVTASELAAAINFAAAQRVQVINMSLYTPNASPDVAQAVSSAVAANIVVIAASGNQGDTSVDFPASTPGVIAVGATDQNGMIWAQSNSGSQVVLAAPGVDIYTDNNLNQQGYGNGTSASTAYVSAAAALVRSEHPSWTAGQVIRDLISTADPGPGQTAGQHNNQYGYGIVDPLKALQAAAPTDTTNPLLTSSDSTGSTSNTSVPTTTASGSHKSSNGLILGIATIVVLILLLLLLIVRLRVKPRG